MRIAICAFVMMDVLITASSMDTEYRYLRMVNRLTEATKEEVTSKPVDKVVVKALSDEWAFEHAKKYAKIVVSAHAVIDGKNTENSPEDISKVNAKKPSYKSCDAKSY